MRASAGASELASGRRTRDPVADPDLRASPRYALDVRRLVPLLLCLSSCLPGNDDDTSDETGACASEPEFVPLIDHAAWEFAPAEEDPLAEHRPATVECGIAGWYVDDGELEVDTNFCNYAAIRQPILRPIEACSTLEIAFYHFDLTAPEPVSAHVAMLIDGQIVWEKFIEVPGDAAVYEEQFPAPFAAPAGSEIMLHLHNHGQNTWALLEFNVGS